METGLVRGHLGWTSAELDEYVDYLGARRYPVGHILAFNRVRGPNPNDPPRNYQVRIEAIQGGQVVLSGKAHEVGDYVWLDLRETPYRAVVLKVVEITRHAVGLAALRRLLWERAAPLLF